jgi:cysteinyl-tRNA synthetase
VRYWLHAEHLLVDSEKMSKSLGNFHTLRELLQQGHKPSSLRFLLASVPYRRQLNFNDDGLRQAAGSVERLRTFALRLRQGKFPEGSSEMSERATRAVDEFEAGLEDDLNTARGLAAIFDLARDANTAMDRGEFHQGDVAPVTAALDKFDAIFAVLVDDDAEKLRALGLAGSDETPADAEIEKLVGERQAARKSRDFAAADRIRQQLADRGILLEDTRDGGIHWKRK